MELPVVQQNVRVLLVRVLNNCNAGCFMCDFAASAGDGFRFTVQQAHDLRDDIARFPYRLLRLTGGEPLMLPDLPDVVKVFSRANLVTSVITNGWYLESQAAPLADCGLDQVIVSIDGALPGTHDRFRNCPGLLDRAMRGIAEFRRQKPSACIRVNTVVGKHNYNEMCEIYELLCRAGVDQWAIIPLKRGDRLWEYSEMAEMDVAVGNLQARIARRNTTNGGPRLLGDSLQWTGRTSEERRRFLIEQRSFTPVDQCRVVDLVRFYTPEDDFVYPCNCLPHRIEGRRYGEKRRDGGLKPAGLHSIRTWLRTNAPRLCKCCEPTNVALGEGRIDLDLNPLLF